MRTRSRRKLATPSRGARLLHVDDDAAERLGVDRLERKVELLPAVALARAEHLWAHAMQCNAMQCAVEMRRATFPLETSGDLRSGAGAATAGRRLGGKLRVECAWITRGAGVEVQRLCAATHLGGEARVVHAQQHVVGIAHSACSTRSGAAEDTDNAVKGTEDVC